MATLWSVLHESGHGSTLGEQLEGLTFIVVDDLQSSRRFLRAMFESFGMKCIGEAQNGFEGVELALRKNPDVISLDLIMPLMHGIEAIKELRLQHFSKIILLVTGLPSIENLATNHTMDILPHAIFQKSDTPETFRTVLLKIIQSQEEESREKILLAS